MCWNAMMAVSVCGDHPSNVLTIRGGWGPYILPPDWLRTPHAVLWLVSSWPRGHTWTRGPGDLVLTAARNVTLCRDIFISSIQWWHSPDIGNIANTGTVLSPRVPDTGSISQHCSPGSGFIGQTRSQLTDTSFCPLLSSAASKCSKLDQKPEIECG